MFLRPESPPTHRRKILVITQTDINHRYHQRRLVRLLHMTFTFLVHPRANLRTDMARLWAPLGLLPASIYDHSLRKLPIKPIKLASVTLGGNSSPAGHLILVPFGARHLLSNPREGSKKVSAAVDRAVALGADIVGLGGLTAPVTAGGNALRNRTDIGVTNGNAYTAFIVHQQIRSLLAVARHGRVGIIGASGSVGTAVTRLLARDGEAAELVLVARRSARLERLATDLSTTSAIRIGTGLAEIANCDIVVLLTSAADTLLGPSHLAQGAIVVDATQPRNTSPDLVAQRPDVLLLDGGIVDVPSMKLKGGDIGLNSGQSYACLAETMLLSLVGHQGHFSLGQPMLEQVDQITEIAGRYRHLGFGPAAASTFGRPVALPATAQPTTLPTKPLPTTLPVELAQDNCAPTLSLSA